MAKLSKVEKDTCKQKAEDFVIKYGNGKNKLTPAQKIARMEKLIGPEIVKIKGYGKKRDEGIPWNTRKIKRGEPITWLLLELSKFPKDIRGRDEAGPHVILDVNIEDSGAASINGIVNNDNIGKIAERNVYSVDFPSDVEVAKFELKQFKEGKLKEVADRTKKIHIDNGDFEDMLNDENLNTGDDSEEQY